MSSGFLEQVRCFVAVAHAGSMTVAAAQLRLAQPTITRQLAALEARLGAPLVRRSARALTLTEQGEKFLPRAERLLQAGQEAVLESPSSVSGFQGGLRVSCSHAFARHVLIPVRQRPWVFKGEAGNVSVRVDGRLSVSTTDALRTAVMADLSVAITPAWFWGDELAQGQVVRLLDHWHLSRKPLHAVTAERPQRDSKESAFADFVQAAFAPFNAA
ncbi:LysR family transcriptional regulator [Paucibacter sp. R3-3]|uniref:LysR family transcriptional regulator n=1 Tax=Roseateles agri TaxID=3098619 RepID=A0ABU5DRH3_9BURK|nr:LysR family transcriptional regulator [Paucibacter sp. R3-3]MDY0748719.1 LysR family transcriptional regulator [Paucibacter sp. R3-3]